MQISLGASNLLTVLCLLGFGLLFWTLYLLGKVGREVLELRSDSREQAERFRAAASQSQSEHLGVLQQQVFEAARLTQQQLSDVQRGMQQRLEALTGSLDTQLGGHGKIIQEVSGQLGALSQAALSLQELGKDISGLQDILRAPKLRGNLGEVFLEEILRQVLPTGSFEMQHRLAGQGRGDTVVVDAVIKLGDRLVPIDSKFPLESFRRLLQSPQPDAQLQRTDTAAGEAERAKRRKAFLEVVKKHIDSIAEKYIRPDCNTYDFAMAYLPAENIYYEAIVRDDTTDLHNSVAAHAAARKVIVVSPNTFYAYLLTVSYGLKGMHIERQAEAMRGQLMGFQKKFSRFFESFEKIGKQMDLSQRTFEEAHKRGLALQGTLGKITGEAAEEEAKTDTAQVQSMAALQAPGAGAAPTAAGTDA
jgi:DNA recombination protein RmuC